MSEQLDFYFSQKQKENDTANAKRAGRLYILTYFKGQEYTECISTGKAPYGAYYGDSVLIGTGTIADVTGFDPNSKVQKSREEKILYWAKQLEGKTLSLHELVENAKWLIANVK